MNVGVGVNDFSVHITEPAPAKAGVIPDLIRDPSDA